MSNLTGVVVLGWNRADITDNFFSGLAQNTDLSKIKICFVDNGSTDDTEEVVRKWTNNAFGDVLHYIKNPRNYGVAAGWNQGIRHHLGTPKVDKIVILNNDIEFLSNQWLEALTDPIRNGERRLVGQNHVEVNAVTVVNGEMIDYMEGWCLAFPKIAIHEIGYFNEDFFPAFYEDVEFSFRAEENGYELYVAPPVLHHISQQSHSKNGKSVFDLFDLHDRHGRIFRETVMRFRSPQEVVVYANSRGHNFYDTDYEGPRGTGGAEASIILLTRELARNGYIVHVYNEILGHYEAQQRLQYHNFRDYDRDETDFFIQYRVNSNKLRQVKAKKKIFYSTDQYTDRGTLEGCNNIWKNELFPHIDEFVCISRYHQKFIEANYSIGRSDFELSYLDLGVNEVDYWPLMEKTPGKMIWCSVPHRGLGYLLDAWPIIKGSIPEAELVITSDYRLWGGNADNFMYLDAIKKLDGINPLWKVDREKVVEQQLLAEIMAAPSIYEENFGISFAECASAGAVPVTTDFGAIKTTVASYGAITDKYPIMNEYKQYIRDDEFSKVYANFLIDLYQDKEKLQRYRDAGRNALFNRFSYKNIVKKWMHNVLV